MAYTVDDNELNKTLNKILMQLVETATHVADSTLVDSMLLDQGSEHYAKDIKGIDNWTAIDVWALPIEGNARSSKAVNPCKTSLT